MAHARAGRVCETGGNARSWSRLARALAVLAPAMALVGGCAKGPQMLPPAEQVTIDRSLVEYPAGFELQPLIRDLTAPTAHAVDPAGNYFVAEGGLGDFEPRIHAFTPEGKRYPIYPIRDGNFLGGRSRFRIYGPIGGMLVHKGRLYVSHRDENDMGVITAFDYWGGHRTIIAGLPAQGEHSVTDLAVDPRSGRLFFGVGTATNSGVVGPDDFEMGWPQKHPAACDIPYTDLLLRGLRFNQPNPGAAFLSGRPVVAVTGAFQPAGASDQTRIKGAPANAPKFSGGIFSVDAEGGDLRVEAHGIRNPAGLAFNDFGQLYFTNQGMELRGTRPVKDDRDALLWVPRAAGQGAATWYGWPDYSTDLQRISEQRFQPLVEMLLPTGYRQVSFVVDHEASGLVAPNPNVLVKGVFQSQSGATGIDFVPPEGPFATFAGSAIVALAGDRAPFGTAGLPLTGPIGYKVVRVDIDRKVVSDFIRNVQPGPASQQGDEPATLTQLERPIDVQFGPDGSMYVLDVGHIQMKDGRPQITERSGKVFRLVPTRRNPANDPAGVSDAAQVRF